MTTTVVVRRIIATPARPAAEAWRTVADLVAVPSSAARSELDRVAGVVSYLIAAEALHRTPLVLHGVGPRLRVYCLYDDQAILGEGASEDPLSWCPTDGDWAMSVPCPPEDLTWVERALANHSERITARDWGEGVPGKSTTGEATSTAKHQAKVNIDGFLRP